MFMFCLNDAHQQGRLFSDFLHFHPSQQKRLAASCAPIFYNNVVCQIDELPFAVLYCADNGRPNFPVNILLSLEYLTLAGLTDEELVEQPFLRPSLSPMLEDGTAGDLIFGQFNTFPAHFVQETGENR